MKNPISLVHPANDQAKLADPETLQYIPIERRQLIQRGKEEIINVPELRPEDKEFLLVHNSLPLEKVAVTSNLAPNHKINNVLIDQLANSFGADLAKEAQSPDWK